MDLVGQEDVALAIEPELIFGVDQDEAAPGGDVHKAIGYARRAGEGC
jgi:hypothetical protein